MAAKKVEENSEVVEKKPKVIKHKITTFFKSLVSTKKRKILTIIASVLILLALIFAIPVTRYFVLSPFVKKDVSLTIIDAKTNKPVSNVKVTIGSVSADSDKDGVVSLKSVPVGQYDLEVKKQYYQDYTTNYTVPVISAPQSPKLDITAVGRQVSVSVTNKITGDTLADVVIEANGTSATTSDDGTATIILPPTDDVVKAVIKKDGYNSSNVELKVDDSVVNAYSMTASGSVYYLSKATGKINVMKANLDGTNSEAVVTGTGQEDAYETSLLSARDWQYSALRATRTDNKQRLYLVDSAKGDLSVIDEGNASFSMVGWSGHNFIYQVYRNTANQWDDRRVALKSFNAETRKLTTLDETSGSGTGYYDYAYESFSSVYIMKNEVAYIKTWNFNQYSADERGSTLYSIPNGSSKKSVKTFPVGSISLKLYEPQGLYIRFQAYSRFQAPNGSPVFYEYEDGAVKTVSDTNDNKFNSSYPTFLISPSGKKTLWYEPRDGKNTLFIGNELGEDAKTIGNLSEYTPYGWYGVNDEYILLTKNGSELYISSATKVIGENGYAPLKITDYHKTQVYPGYGYGYGGQ